MISYYDEINITEIICYNEKLALITELCPFSFSTDNSVSDIGQIDDFKIIDVRKNQDQFLLITSLNFSEFQKNYQIEKIENILKNKFKPSVLDITKKAREKKEAIVKIIQEKLPCNLLSYYIARFGLLLVFDNEYFNKNLFIKKLYEKSINCAKADILPFTIGVKYQILNKTFIWLYLPEDLAILQNKNIFKCYLKIFDTNLLFKPLFDFRYKIATSNFEIIESLYPKTLPSVYLTINEDKYFITSFMDKRVEIIENQNIVSLLNDYNKIAYEVIKRSD